MSLSSESTETTTITARVILALTSATRQYDGNRWESRWYEVYNEVLICAWDVRADLTIAPQFELHKMLADGDGVMNVVKNVVVGG